MVGESDLESVWHPLEFNAFEAPEVVSHREFLLSHIADIVLHDAFYRNDPNRALRSIRIGAKILAPSESRWSYGSLIYYDGLLSDVRRTLMVDFWSKKQLEALQEILAVERDLERVLNDSVVQRTLVLSPCFDDPRKLELFYRQHSMDESRRSSSRESASRFSPSQAWNVVLFQYQAMPKMKEKTQDLRRFRFRYDQWLRRPTFLGNDSIRGDLVGWKYQSQKCREVAEDPISTQTAIAIRQYQRANGELPETLGDLTAIGWTASRIVAAEQVLTWLPPAPGQPARLTVLNREPQRGDDQQPIPHDVSREVVFTDSGAVP